MGQSMNYRISNSGLTQLMVFRRSWTAALAVLLPLNCVSPMYIEPESTIA
jgi:hypothetical protein